MKKTFLKKLLSSLIFNGLGFFTLLFFSPLEVYIGNPSDFRIFVDSAVIILALTALALTVVLSFILSFLPVKILKIINLSIFSTTVCFYVQSLFLNGSMNILTGESLTVSKFVTFINIAVWILIICLVFAFWFLFKKSRKEKVFISTTKYIALALVIMQLTGFLSMYINYDKSINESKTLYCSTDGQFELSKNKNVLYFIVDNCDTAIVNEALEQDPNMFAYFNGFTCYTDNVFTHSRSFPAITYLLSGEKCYYNLPYNEYVDNALKNSKFLNTIDKLGTDIRVYTDPRLIGAASKEIIDNSKTISSFKLSDINMLGFLKQSLKVSGFRGLPYFAKSRFFYDTETVNSKSLVSRKDAAPINNDPMFYTSILSEQISTNNKYTSALRFYHMFGSHPGAVINENGEYQIDVTLPQALRGNLKIIQAYLEKLKATDAYDNTTIIITADHGEFQGELSRPQTCLLLVKEAGADTSLPIDFSDAPVCQEDLFPTVLKALGANYSDFGTPLSEISENETRTRYHYNTEIDFSNGYETTLREYTINGTASNLENYEATGKEWKVKSSLSPH